MKKLIVFFKKIFGQVIFKIGILGVQIFSITKVKPECFNIYILYLPCFRIRKSKSTFGFNLLLFSWLYDFFASFKIFQSVDSWGLSFGQHRLFERIRNESINALKICGRNFYGVYKKEAYKFSTAAFKG